MVHSLPPITITQNQLTQVTATPKRVQSVTFTPNPTNSAAIFVFDTSTGSLVTLTGCIRVVGAPVSSQFFSETITQQNSPGGIDISKLYVGGNSNSTDIVVISYVMG